MERHAGSTVYPNAKPVTRITLDLKSSDRRVGCRGPVYEEHIARVELAVNGDQATTVNSDLFRYGGQRTSEPNRLCVQPCKESDVSATNIGCDDRFA